MLPAEGDFRTGFLGEGPSAHLKGRLGLPVRVADVYKDTKM